MKLKTSNGNALTIICKQTKDFKIRLSYGNYHICRREDNNGNLPHFNQLKYNKNYSLHVAKSTIFSDDLLFDTIMKIQNTVCF